MSTTTLTGITLFAAASLLIFLFAANILEIRSNYVCDTECSRHLGKDINHVIGTFENNKCSCYFSE